MQALWRVASLTGHFNGAKDIERQLHSSTAANAVSAVTEYRLPTKLKISGTTGLDTGNRSEEYNRVRRTGQTRQRAQRIRMVDISMLWLPAELESRPGQGLYIQVWPTARRRPRSPLAEALLVPFLFTFFHSLSSTHFLPFASSHNIHLLNCLPSERAFQKIENIQLGWLHGARRRYINNIKHITIPFKSARPTKKIVIFF